NKWLLASMLVLSVNVWAEPIIVEGVVPNDASKQIILNKMYSVYGADQVIDYHTTDFSEVLENVDLVFDTMGGEVQAKSFKILNEHGRLISIVSQPDEELANTVAVAESIWLQPNGEQLQEIADLMADGKVKSVVGHTYPLTAAGVTEAHELSATHHAKGKIVLTNE
ncbi:MAG: zinc-binding dehydrogenase, partial [Enterococcus sp.]